MKIRGLICIAVVILLSFLAGSCIILPTISETHLLSDIQEDELSITVGTDQLIGEPGIILPDVLYEYLSYAPADWVEFGIAGHYGIGFLGIDARFDIIDMFTDDNPLSAMLLGGALLFSGGSAPLAHFGGAANYKINRFVEVYAAAATSTLFFVPVFHIGTHVNIFDWLALSGNLKIAVNTVETNVDVPPAAIMISVAPRISFSL